MVNISCGWSRNAHEGRRKPAEKRETLEENLIQSPRELRQRRGIYFVERRRCAGTEAAKARTDGTHPRCLADRVTSNADH